MKLMTEQLFETFQVQEEVIDEATGKKTLHLEGIFLQTEMKNRNGRMYPKAVMEGEVGRYVKEYVNKGRAFGELGHPQGPTVNLDRASHIITSLKEDGNNYIGKAKIMDTPNGRIVRGILESGGQLGVSSRGMGSLVQKKGLMEVQKDFKLATAADIVADPSAPDAFVNGIMENVEFFYDDSIGWYAEEVKRHVKTLSTREIQEQRLQIFEDFLAKL